MDQFSVKLLASDYNRSRLEKQFWGESEDMNQKERNVSKIINLYTEPQKKVEQGGLGKNF